MVWAEKRSARVDLHTARAEAARAVRQVQEIQRVYDSTPTGQRELTRLISEADAAGNTAASKRLHTRLVTAQTYRTAVMRRWKASSAYTEERLADLIADHQGNLRDVADRVRELRIEIGRRRADEHGVMAPPTHPKARASWEQNDPRGRTWRAVADLVNPAAASLTYSDPGVHAAAEVYTKQPDDQRARDALLAAYAKALPACLAPEDDPSHHMYRAAATGRPWTVDADHLADLVAARGARRIDRDGAAATGAEQGDEWRVVRVVGPVRITGGPAPVDAAQGWVCVRVRDHLWRILAEDVLQARLEVPEPTGVK